MDPFEIFIDKLTNYYNSENPKLEIDRDIFAEVAEPFRNKDFMSENIFIEIVRQAEYLCIDRALSDLIHMGLAEIHGVDEDGELTYKITELGESVGDQIMKDI